MPEPARNSLRAVSSICCAGSAYTVGMGFVVAPVVLVGVRMGMARLLGLGADGSEFLDGVVAFGLVAVFGAVLAAVLVHDQLAGCAAGVHELLVFEVAVI